MLARCLLVLLLLLIHPNVIAQNIGDNVRLESSNLKGVPVHLGAGDNSFFRWANGTIGIIKEIDPATGWYKVEASGKYGWVVKKYITVIKEDIDVDVEESAEDEVLSYVVGSWNLEHFRDNAVRGFPEYTYNPPGPKYVYRNDDDFEQIAEIIENQIFAKILVLNEINGHNKHSRELDRLLTYLGNNWKYELTVSGKNQRIAMLYDLNVVRLDTSIELAIDEQRIQGKDILEKDPLVCKFTFLDTNGDPNNDLIVIGIHLASGQPLVQNHNKAMEELCEQLHREINNNPLLTGEKDVLIAGDFNASRYDNKIENFWEGYDDSGFRFQTLSPEDGTQYPATRLAGVPLYPRSQIDYILASGITKGIVDDLLQLTAHVHTELVTLGFDNFREHISDHLPVTIRVRVLPDDD